MEKTKKCESNLVNSCSNGSSCIYFLGFIGAVVYYISTTTGFWNIVWAILKSFIWPVFLVFEVLKFIGA